MSNNRTSIEKCAEHTDDIEQQLPTIPRVLVANMSNRELTKHVENSTDFIVRELAKRIKP